MTKYEFGSREWCAALQGVITERVAWESQTRPNVAMSICEVFTDAPERMSDGGRKVAWSCVENSVVDFRPSERDDVQFKVVGDYETILTIGRYDTRGEPDRVAELAKLAKQARGSGKLTTVGERIASSQALSSVHDAIARLTA